MIPQTRRLGGRPSGPPVVGGWWCQRKVAFVRSADSADVAAVTAAVDEAASTFGRLDVLVNNAGVFLVGPPEDLGPAELDRTLAVNVRAPFVASQAAGRHMTDGGRIISIGSTMAERAVFPGSRSTR